MTEADYRPYKALAAAIVEEHCKYYHELYLKYLRHPHNPYYIRRLNEVKIDLKYFSFAEYLDLDTDAVIRSIEKKVKEGEKFGNGVTCHGKTIY